MSKPTLPSGGGSYLRDGKKLERQTERVAPTRERDKPPAERPVKPAKKEG